MLAPSRPPLPRAPTFFPRHAAPPCAGDGAGLRVLVLLCRAGHSCQEALLLMSHLRSAGADVTIAGLDTTPVRLDRTCTVIAWLERLWSPAWRLLQEARSTGALDQRRSLADLDGAGELDQWVRRFDAVVIPGGHGIELDRFLHDPLVLGVVERVYACGGVVGLQCHATLVAALVRTGDTTLADGRHMVCWPRRPEALLGALPFVSTTYQPFGRPVEDLLVAAGARVHREGGALRGPQAAIDGRVVSSRGPWSVDAFSAALVRAVRAAQGQPDHAAI